MRRGQISKLDDFWALRPLGPIRRLLRAPINAGLNPACSVLSVSLGTHSIHTAIQVMTEGLLNSMNIIARTTME